MRMAILAVVLSLASLAGAQVCGAEDAGTPANLRVADSTETQIITTREGSEL